MDDDDRFGTDLLAPLRAEPRGPSAVDVRRAVVRGERRQATIRAAGAAAAVLVALGGGWVLTGPRASGPAPGPAATPAGPPVPSACVPKALGTPPEFTKIAQVDGGDPTGRYQVGLVANGQTGIWVLWDRGEAHPLDPRALYAADVNANGAVVGTSWADENQKDGVAWTERDGRFQELAGAHATAAGINDRGQIAGTVAGKPVTWASADSPPVELEVPAPYDTPARVNGIDEDGTVVGGLFRNGFYVPVVWTSDGRFQALTVPRGDGVFPNLTADGIRNGWVIGRSGDKTVRWDLRSGARPTLVSGGYNAMGPNSSGWLVWQVFPGAELRAGDARISLRMPAQTSGTSLIQPKTISDDGRTIAGEVPNDQSGSTAYLWTCR
ncbi:hypothetical protein ABT369_38005 [Dactylosporangium sp. NPDC000244]|uniref:hypothetical protein n=1 Tax=Dactylosporangium sp. NPDC000244 TaxID=3154365 RepID=UPI0033258C07